MSTDDGAPFATRAETIEGIASALESRRDDAAATKADTIEDEDATPSEQWYEAGREDAFGTAAELVRAWDNGSPVAPAARDCTDDQHPPGAIEVLGMDWTDDTLAIEYECLACETALVARVGLGGRTLAVSEPDTEYWWRRDRGERPVPSTAAVEGSGTDAETIEENVRATVTWGTSGPPDRDTVVETVAEDLGESDRAVDQCVRAMVRRGELVARDGELRRVETDGGTEVEAEAFTLRDAVEAIPDGDPESITLLDDGHGHFVINSEPDDQDVDRIDELLGRAGYERDGHLPVPEMTQQNVAPTESDR
ncbi:hypothetical protein [Haloglomus salinum]|uniref:hypothetical protein n=1 Tax=Haloglomus salinum TaxID=2962673 RepID=UPI0020C991E0|nr:hypothetical protein [Haloglomus salinum]